VTKLGKTVSGAVSGATIAGKAQAYVKDKIGTVKKK